MEKLVALLKEKLAAAQAICDTADRDRGGIMTDEEVRQYDTLMAEVKAVKEAIARKQALDDETTQANASAGRRAAPAAAGSAVRTYDNRQDDPTAGFHNLAEFSLAVRAASVKGGARDPRLDVMGAPSNFHQENGSSDGYEVPEQFRSAIIELVNAADSLANMVETEPTEGNSVSLLADETTPWGSTGIQAYWAAEGQKMDPSRLETEGRQVKLHKLYAFVLATDELLEDAPRLNSRLTKGSAQAIDWKRTESIITGSGAGRPLGYMNSGALITVNKEAAQAADTLVAMNVANMYSRMLASSIPRAIWYINSDVIPQLMTLQIANQPIWTPPSAGFANAPGGFLLGRPIMLTEHAETLGDKGDIQFIDPKGYYSPVKSAGVKFDSSIHLYFDYGLQAFRWTFRVGGQPFLSKPVAPAKGPNTKSHFVVLEARA